MTKKDYERFAKMFREDLEHVYRGDRQQFAEALMMVLKEDNPKFDAKQFWKASDLDWIGGPGRFDQ